MVGADDENADARALGDRLDDIGRRQNVTLATSKRDATTPSGTGTPAARSNVLATSFCMATADAITPEWYRGWRGFPRCPASVPSSPGRPCRTLSATSGLTVASTVGDVASDVDPGDPITQTRRAPRRRPCRSAATRHARPTSPPSVRRRACSCSRSSPASPLADSLDRPIESRLSGASRVHDVDLTFISASVSARSPPCIWEAAGWAGQVKLGLAAWSSTMSKERPRSAVVRGNRQATDPERPHQRDRGRRARRSRRRARPDTGRRRARSVRPASANTLPARCRPA